MIFTLTDRHYNVLDAYETDDYLIGQYIGSILETLEINVLVKSLNAEHWVEGNYIMCQDKSGKKRWFTIYDCDDSHSGDVKSLFCYSGTIDIVAEDAAPISAPDPKPFKWYFDQIFYDTGIVLGINEISDLTRKLEFTSENASNAEMLQYVLNGFDNAEASLDVEFDGATPTKLVLNVYKRIGNEEPQAILSDEDDSLTSLNRKGSISDLATCINPTGAEDENGNPITLVGKYYEERDEQGNILYYSPVDSPRVFSVVARQNFYVQLPGKANGEFDGYINRRYESQATTQDTLWQESLAQLKKIDHVAVTYEANGYIDCSIGDNVQIVSHEMKPPVMIAARTIEYKFNDDDPSRNVYKFGNYVELASNLDDLSKIIAEVKKQVEPQVIEAERNAKVYAETISAEKAAQAEENAKGYTDTVKVQVVEHADTVANQAENNAKSHADTVAGEAESNAKAYALSEADKARIAAIQAAATDAQTKVNAAKTALEADIATKVDAQWVNGQLISKADKASTYTKTEVDNALNSKVSTTTYTTDKAGIVNRLDNAESRITQTEKDITSKVSQTTFTQELSKKENSVTKSNTAPTSPTTNQLWLDTSVTPNILKRWSGTEWVKATPTTAAEVGAYTKSETDTKLGGKADTSAVTALETRMSTAETGIQQTASAIELKANKTDVYTKTEVNNALANKADNTRVATVESRVTTAEASIKTQADAIALRALKTDVYTKTEADGKISTAVNNAKADIKLTTDSISQSVSSLQSTVSGHGTRLNSAESSITSLSTQIQSKVSQTTFESALSGKENTVYKQNTAPAHANGRFWLDTSKTPNVLYRSNGSAWIKVTPTLAGEVGAFSQADGKTLAGRLSTAESTITQQAGLISSKAESSTVTALGTRVTTAEQNINGLTGQISQKVSKTDYNGNTIASLINQTATTIKLQASKINLVGAVTVLSDITGNLGDITAGNISGVNITGVTITGSNIISDGVWQTIQSRVQLGNGVITVGDSSANNTVSPVGFIVEQDGGRLHHEFGSDGILFYGSFAERFKAGVYVQYEPYGNGISMILGAENYTAVTSKFWVRNNEARFQSTENFIDPEPNVKKAIKASGGISTDGLYANTGSVSKNAIATNGKIYVGGEGIELSWPGGTPYIDFSRRAGVDCDMRIMLDSSSNLCFVSSDYFVRHRFSPNGTKSGGSIEVDGKNLGMSPIDSPQVLLETIEFDVPLTADGTKVLLDSRFAKAVNYRFAVFPNHGEVIEKGADYFIIAGEGLADIRIIGERVGYAGVYFDDMTMEGVV